MTSQPDALRCMVCGDRAAYKLSGCVIGGPKDPACPAHLEWVVAEAIQYMPGGMVVERITI